MRQNITKSHEIYIYLYNIYTQRNIFFLLSFGIKDENVGLKMRLIDPQVISSFVSSLE